MEYYYYGLALVGYVFVYFVASYFKDIIQSDRD